MRIVATNENDGKTNLNSIKNLPILFSFNFFFALFFIFQNRFLLDFLVLSIFSFLRFLFSFWFLLFADQALWSFRIEGSSWHATDRWYSETVVNWSRDTALIYWITNLKTQF